MGLVVDESGPSLETIVVQTRAAARAGFGGVWMSQRTGRDALTPLAVAGHEVPGIELGTAVIPTHPRHPLAGATGVVAMPAGPDEERARTIGLLSAPTTAGAQELG
ncbi:LLM class flavin-dependent oxidoreductase [Streptomyces sp. WG5]|uniref:LLM class flavin-dependent oxidoreductase n=1 Tax=Streptomyces sp. WG5 TaxID=3417648 RepID=UPI003CEC1A5E